MPILLIVKLVHIYLWFSNPRSSTSKWC